MTITKNLSNPYSTGGGGAHFEAHIQASFVALMLTGGHTPCLPCWPIKEIKLQGKISGFDTDDLVVVVENANNKEQRKFLGQVKHSITITKGNAQFAEVIQAAWNDFNNPRTFTQDKDAIALITGPLSVTDAHNVSWLLDQAKHTKDVNEFFRNVQQAKFSPPKSEEKLNVIQYHLKAANGGKHLSNDELYSFLNHFYLLGYDLGNESGVVLSLLHSHISQFHQQYPQFVWSRIVDVVQTWNQNAGTITLDRLPEDLREAFKQQIVAEMPEKFNSPQKKPKTIWANHPDATYLALIVFIGAWQDARQCDTTTITQLLGISYEEWLNKARELLHCADSPLTLKNGTWKVADRIELLNQLGSRIFDHDLDTFKALVVSVLSEPDPAFELPMEERYAANIHGKVLECSHELRKGIAEGLAILGSQPEACSNCSQNKAEAICVLAIRELLTNADWVLWGSLNVLLPTLAEVAPKEFLDMIERAMRQTPCPFDELFSQEGDGITGGNYLTGLLWALEGLAWDEQYFVRTCTALAELSSHDPGGKWADRPFSSLKTILLPWLPQTLASVEKRKVVVRTILNEWPNIAWDLIIQLLPGQQRFSSGSHKPIWRKIIPDDFEKGVTQQEYWEQTTFYAEIAVAAAGENVSRLTELVGFFDKLPAFAFDQLVQTLTSQPILKLPEEKRFSIWDHLSKFISQHRRFSGEEWVLSDELIIRLEQAAEKIAPNNPFNLHQYLFTNSDFELYEEDGDWEAQKEKLDTRREKAISEIFQHNGAEGVLLFATLVPSPYQVGHALAIIDNITIEKAVFPQILDSTDYKLKAFVGGFIWQRWYLKGWEWCDSIDKSDWTPEQVGYFLACLPFTEEAWDRAAKWLQICEGEYWTRANANAYQANKNLAFAIEKLIEYDRPHSAINCLSTMLFSKQPIDSDQCIRALLAALLSSEPGGSSDTMKRYHIVELIKFLQVEPQVNSDDLFKIEWAYLPLLDGHRGATPKILESKLVNDPEFFCELIQRIYRSDKEDQPPRTSTQESKAIATNAWRLLHEWKTPPGKKEDGIFNEAHFTEWLRKVKYICTESGHLEVALVSVGEVLIHTPSDPAGLWIHCSVAAALNDREAGSMRDGFRTGIYNARGVHMVDPTGKPERELAEQFRRKAEEVEDVGFQRFATTLRGLADSYDREAERIINDPNGW